MMSQPASACDQRLPDQHRDGLVVDDLAAAQQPVMAVAGVGIERHVAQDADLGHLLLDRADRPADQIVRVERLACRPRRAASDRCRGRARGTGCRASRRARPRAPPGRPKAARRPASRRPARARSLPVDNEQRPDQVVGGEHALAHHAPRPFGLAVAPHAGGEVERAPRVRGVSTGRRRAEASIGRPYLMAMAIPRRLHCRARPGTPSYHGILPMGLRAIARGE